MAYKLIVSPRAQREIENAIDYYALYSDQAPAKFIATLQNTYNSLTSNPFYGIRYDNIRAVKMKVFPYSLYFVINENNNTIRVLSCFHNRQNPQKRPAT